MTLVRVLCIAAWLSVPGSAMAQACSGGPDGGMDATGNQCSVAPSKTAPPPREVKAITDQPQRVGSRKLASERRATLQTPRVARPNLDRATLTPRGG